MPDPFNTKNSIDFIPILVAIVWILYFSHNLLHPSPKKELFVSQGRVFWDVGLLSVKT